jgi:zinc transport system substrate-binding protein
MKRFIGLRLIALAAFIVAAAGCGAGGITADSGGKLSVVATIFAPYDFAREITGDSADLTMLIPPGAETHSYEPTPQDIIKIQNCDVFVYVGGESDEWVDDILESIDSDLKIVTLMDCVEVFEEEIVEGMEEEEEEEFSWGNSQEEEEASGEAEYDEHVWTSPKNAKLIVEKLSGAFCEADPANADVYRQNTAKYLAALDELDAAFQNVVDNARRNTIVLGDRFPFRYFAEAYGLSYFAAFPGCSTET